MQLQKTGSFGVDYSSRVVYLALMIEEEIKATLILNIEKEPFDAFLKLAEWLRLKGKEHNVDYIYIEQPWVNGKVFPKSGLMLARTAAVVEIASYAADLWPRFVHPLAWRKKVYGNVKPKDRKEYAREFTRSNFGFDTKYKQDHNISEAVCIARYGVLHQEAIMRGEEE